MMSALDSLLPTLGRPDYARAAGLGAAAGATGSLAGQLFGLLDTPRKAMWSMIPGLHGDDGEAYSGSQVAGNMFDVDPDSIGGRLGGTLLDTVLDPLTLALGPLGGLAGGRGALAAERVGLANRAAGGAAASTEALSGAAQAARAAAAAVPDYSAVAGLAGKSYPTDMLREALSTGELGRIRRYGGVSGLGSTVKRPQSQYLIDQLERQGFGSSILDAAGQPTDRMLLAGDQQTRSMFAPRGGRLMQVGEVGPEARGPLAPLFHQQPPVPSAGEALGPGLDEVARRSPLLNALLGEQEARFPDLASMPADAAAGLFEQASARTGPALDRIRQELAGLPIERLLARRLTGNAIGV